jgi:hypothetical protein
MTDLTKLPFHIRTAVGVEWISLYKVQVDGYPRIAYMVLTKKESFWALNKDGEFLDDHPMQIIKLKILVIEKIRLPYNGPMLVVFEE